MSLEIKLNRLDRVYRPPDVIDGMLVIDTPSSVSHQGVRLTAAGTIMLQLSARQVGVFESLYTSVKPIELMHKVVDIQASGKFHRGITEVPFAISLETPKGGKLFESFHGAYVNIQYLLTAELIRGYLQKQMSVIVEFMVEGNKEQIPRLPFESTIVNFYITQDTQKHMIAPVLRSGGFKITGRVVTQCSLSEYVTGELTVEHSAVPVSSIDIQLLRVESVAAGDRMATETSEIQTTQVADGDICRGLAVPIYMVLPRLLTCPTLSAGAFSLEFELSIVITFEAGLSRDALLHDPNTSKLARLEASFSCTAEDLEWWALTCIVDVEFTNQATFGIYVFRALVLCLKEVDIKKPIAMAYSGPNFVQAWREAEKLRMHITDRDCTHEKKAA